MTVVFVHGVPVTSAVWTPLLKELSAFQHDEVVRLSPPGFGAPLPADFGATIEGLPELARCRAFAIRRTRAPRRSRLGRRGTSPRSRWPVPTCCAAGSATPSAGTSRTSSGTRWHSSGRRPARESGASERSSPGTPASGAARMVEWGIPEPAAGEVALAQGADMGRAILALYRSAVPPVLVERGRDLPAAAARPGLVLVPTEDVTVGSVAARHRAAGRAGARAVELDGLGHWWMLQDPARGGPRAVGVLERPGVLTGSGGEGAARRPPHRRGVRSRRRCGSGRGPRRRPP
ncbi:alpha/beta fold hydrolase [Nonomuraea rubra]|uniref:alpha/beta fold hydrolase n=1 Tax=Nonomuraea rubra TaxID=46180 RepID=UPI003CD06625